MDAVKKYELVFNGFWRYEIRNKLPQKPGLLFVYRGVRILRDGHFFCDLKEIMSIYKTTNICNQALSEDVDLLQKYLDEGEILYFSCCELPNEFQSDVYMGFLNTLNPKYVKNSISTTNNIKIQIQSFGKISLFDSNIIVVI